ncbi:DUF58 domain-containing protein [Synechococcus elongatus]|uniref:DUF58 domain-containing protein n=1 Tax=Synechococcus elongatus TaxID=32046 RepID=UPI0030D12156
MKLRQWLKQLGRSRFEAWLARQLPPRSTIRLNRERIFIFPSQFGAVFLALDIAFYLIGTNYQNNLVLLLSLLLLSLFLGCIFQSFRNLDGLELEALPAADGQVGEPLRLSVRLRTETSRYALRLHLPSSDRLRLAELRSPSEIVSLTVVPSQRGLYRPGRLQVRSDYPLGLFRTWTVLDLDWQAVILPQPERWPLQTEAIATTSATPEQPVSTVELHQTTSEEFAGLQPYQPGESLRRVAWKQLAQGRGLHSKAFAGERSQQRWLSLQHTPGQDLEQRLRRLTWAVQELSRRGEFFGLVLGSQRWEADTGSVHQRTCLQAIALYGLERTV